MVVTVPARAQGATTHLACVGESVVEAFALVEAACGRDCASGGRVLTDLARRLNEETHNEPGVRGYGDFLVDPSDGALWLRRELILDSLSFSELSEALGLLESAARRWGGLRISRLCAVLGRSLDGIPRP